MESPNDARVAEAVNPTADQLRLLSPGARELVTAMGRHYAAHGHPIDLAGYGEEAYSTLLKLGMSARGDIDGLEGAEICVGGHSVDALQAQPLLLEVLNWATQLAPASARQTLTLRMRTTCQGSLTPMHFANYVAAVEIEDDLSQFVPPDAPDVMH